MLRISECHEEREDHLVISVEDKNNFISLFSVSEHFVEKGRTQVAEIWITRDNAKTLVNEIKSWLNETESSQKEQRAWELDKS